MGCLCYGEGVFICAVVRVMDLAVLWGRCFHLCCGEDDGCGCAVGKVLWFVLR